jgi:hypothetical protein
MHAIDTKAWQGVVAIAFDMGLGHWRWLEGRSAYYQSHIKYLNILKYPFP